MSAKTIQIFLPDGNPRSIKIAEITSRTVLAVLIPRSKLDDAAKRNELSSVGVYFLIGPQEEETKPLLYIGEAEDCLVRLKQHNKSKDFWTHALVMISRTEYFTKTHIKFLEYHCYLEAQKANRFRLENTNTPSRPHISEAIEADLLDNFETIKILSSTLGHPFFDEMKKAKPKQVLVCKGKDAIARGEYTEDGLIVFAGSICNLKETNTAGSWITNMRKKLVESEILTEDSGVYRFTSDHIFSSPSAAAGTVLARRANGWIEWKYNDGKTLDEIKRQIET